MITFYNRKVHKKSVRDIKRVGCVPPAGEPNFGGEISAEFIGWSNSACDLFINCYFDTHFDGYYKLRAWKKTDLKGNIVGYFPLKSKVDFTKVEFKTNWRCKFRYKYDKQFQKKICLWDTAEQFILDPTIKE